MRSEGIDILSTVLTIVISIGTIAIFLVRYFKKTYRKEFKNSAMNLINSLKVTDLNSESDLVKSMGRAQESRKLLDAVKAETNENTKWIRKHEKDFLELSETIHSIEATVNKSERERFKADLRNRLEYIINKKGLVDRSYWDSVVSDYDVYVNKLHLNSYMKTLYEEAEDLYINSNIKSK